MQKKGDYLRIDSSYVGMESARTYSSTNVKGFRFFVKAGSVKENTAGFGQLLNTDVKDETDTETKGNEVGGSEESTGLQERFQSMSGLNRVSLREQGSLIDSIREQCFRYIFELLFGSKSRKTTEATEQQVQAETTGTGLQVNAVALNYEEVLFQSETESTSFSNEGMVKTADGREINFNVNVEMSRSFSQYYEQNYSLPNLNLCDPLVINLEGSVAGLSDQKFLFDIDADGEMDSISALEASSGYLALDKNEDGTINDGSELFGTSSGDGFKDLSRYDEDGNGWIDENDEVWNKLKIWVKDENGQDVLYRLADKGVGAICLQKADTQFGLLGKDNRTNGVIRSTGVFLYENGNAGTMQHVDVAKENVSLDVAG